MSLFHVYLLLIPIFVISNAFILNVASTPDPVICITFYIYVLFDYKVEVYLYIPMSNNEI